MLRYLPIDKGTLCNVTWRLCKVSSSEEGLLFFLCFFMMFVCNYTTSKFGGATKNIQNNTQETSLSHITNYNIYICSSCHTRNGAAIWGRMRAVTSGVSTGGTLALVFKLLDWADKHPSPALCEALQPPAHWSLDFTSFILGLVFGVGAYATIQYLVVLRWALIHWLSGWQSDRSAIAGGKGLYKLL